MAEARPAFARLRSGDEVMFGLYAPGDGCDWELGMRWRDLGASVGPTPRLEVFRDAWEAFEHPVFQRLFEDLRTWRDRFDTSIDSFCELLTEHGFVDDTRPPEADPYIKARDALLQAVVDNGCDDPDDEPCGECWACLADAFLTEAEVRR